jgi:hypothetical protein
MEFIRSIKNYMYSLIEDELIVEVRHGGNQFIDEFYMKKEDGSPNYNKSKYMTYSIVKSKTILDLKNKIKIKRADGTYLPIINPDGTTSINLREEVFGPTLKDTCPVNILEKDNGILKLYIQIPDW